MFFSKNKDKKTKSVYMSAKDEKAIAKHNKLEIARLEKLKTKKITESDYITTMRDSNNIVEFDNLHTYFFTDRGVVKAVNGVSFDIPKGKIVGVVGESGCGKSVTAMSLMRLIAPPHGQIVDGDIRFLDKENKVYNVAKTPMSVMHKIRGKEISMIFQEPMTSLNPVFKIGMQLDEVSMVHLGYKKKQAKEWSIELLKKVGIADAESIYDKYPHQLSGGMRQRVMISIALACKPRLIVADEPTTALDVTIQAQILDLLREIRTELDGSIMLITHDLGVIAEMADYVIVMYAGRVIEAGTAKEIFAKPSHPYNIGLQESKPTMGKTIERLYSIKGNVPNPINMPSYCYFKDRCAYAQEVCDEYPPRIDISDTHYACCHFAKTIQKHKKRIDKLKEEQDRQDLDKHNNDNNHIDSIIHNVVTTNLNEDKNLSQDTIKVDNNLKLMTDRLSEKLKSSKSNHAVTTKEDNASDNIKELKTINKEQVNTSMPKLQIKKKPVQHNNSNQGIKNKVNSINDKLNKIKQREEG